MGRIIKYKNCRLWLPCLILLAALFSCKEEVRGIEDPGWDINNETKDELVVMTYNTRYCTPYLVENAKPDIDAIAAIINKANPDVVLLQEVDRNTTRSGQVNQAAELAKKTDMKFSHYGKSLDYQNGEVGCCILSRYSLTEMTRTLLPRIDGQTEDRLVISANIRFNNKVITVACTHLGLHQEERDAEVPALNAALPSSPNAVILGGDFNATPENATMTTIAGYGFARTNTLVTWTIPSNQPNRQLDYIMYRPESTFTVVSHTVMPDRASDHLAVVAVLKIK